jgi:hypothetical protein
MGNGDTPTLYTTDDTGNYVEYEPPAPPAFKDSLPEDLRGSEHLSEVEDGAQLARYYVDLKSNQHLPPDSADGYEFEFPEGFDLDEDTQGQFKQLAFDKGLSQDQYKDLMSFEIERYNAALEAVNKSIDDRAAESEKALKTEWGNDYEKNVEAAKSVINHQALADESFKSFLNETRFGDNPEVIKFFHRLSQLISEDSLKKPGVGQDSEPAGVKRGEDGRPMLDFPSMDGQGEK